MRAHLMNRPIERAEEGLASVVVAVDDTDDATRCTSTGEIASLIAAAAVDLGGYLRLEVTRHQLLLRDDIPYTSHNSSMVFEALIPPGLIDDLRERAIAIIVAHRAETSDPGLCFACVPDQAGQGWCTATSAGSEAREVALAVSELVSFGRRAKVEFCSKETAYALAARVPWVVLSEHGGDGAGIVGALAGVGLRLGGCDGRFRGKWNFAKLCAGELSCSVGAVEHRLARDFRGPVQLVDERGMPLDPVLPFSLDAEGKPILYDGALTVVCDVVDGVAHPCSKIDLGEIGNVGESWSRVCSSFEWDNDVEECLDHTPSCKNCLHRRWVAGGFQCARNRAMCSA